MDNKYRTLGNKSIENAEYLEASRALSQRIRMAYITGIEWYEKISNKTQDDFKIISTTCKDVAVSFFNSSKYIEAGQYYMNAINAINSILKLKDLANQDNPEAIETDTEYRKLTELYIDVSDVLSHLHNHVAASESLLHAATAFQLIKNKSIAEIAIGDPNNNLQKFHLHFEEKLSTTSYLNSATFRNHEQILCEKHEMKNLSDMLDAMSLPEKENHFESIEAMLSKLSVSQRPCTQHFFSPITINKPTNEDHFRDAAVDFLRLTQTHIMRGVIADTCNTYKQALDALKEIKHKSVYDLQTIQSIEEQIKFLQSRAPMSGYTANLRKAQPIIEQNNETYLSLISKINNNNTFSESVNDNLMMIEDDYRMEM